MGAPLRNHQALNRGSTTRTGFPCLPEHLKVSLVPSMPAPQPLEIWFAEPKGCAAIPNALPKYMSNGKVEGVYLIGL